MAKYLISNQEGKLVLANSEYVYDYALLTRKEWESISADLQKLESTTKQMSTVLKIARERANRDRDIRPREQRSGYIFISSQSRYNAREKSEVWKTLLQTPYPIEYGETIDKLVRRDFHNLNLWRKLGLHNFEYLEYKVDSKTGYWTVIITHNDACERVDSDLLPDSKDSHK